MAAPRRVSIKTPDQLDLRSIQQAIDNIRERITGAETLADTLSSSSTAKVGNDARTVAELMTQIQALNSQLTALQLKVGALAEPNDVDYLASALQPRVFELEKRVDEPRLDMDPAARAMIAALTARVDALEQGIHP